MSQLIQDHLEACSDIRAHALAALGATIEYLQSDQPSERKAMEYFARQLKEQGIPSYWYPAGEEAGAEQWGCIVAFDTHKFPSRTAFSNGRLWAASDENFWEGFGYFYASPQQLTPDGLVAWGDIGCTVYLGDDPAIRAAVRAAWNRNEAVFRQLSTIPSPTTMDLFTLNAGESARRSLVNIAWSTSTNGYNIGHCFPTTYVPDLNDPQVDQLASRRVYVDGVTDKSLGDALWTYEARDRSPDYPQGSVQFHEVVTLTGKGIVRLPSYREILAETGMEWLTG